MKLKPEIRRREARSANRPTPGVWPSRPQQLAKRAGIENSSFAGLNEVAAPGDGRTSPLRPIPSFVIHHSSFCPAIFSRRRRERGFISVVFMALLAIMMILVTAESRALFGLHREVKHLEQQQIQRLVPPATNVVAAATSETS